MSAVTMEPPMALIDIPETDYHADTHIPGGTFSSTMAKRILRSPAHLRHYLDGGRVESTAFDVGHAIHAKVLGVGMPVIVYPDEHLTPSGNVSEKKATLEWAAEQRDQGLVPIAPERLEAVDAMAEAVLAHPIAGKLLAAGMPEKSAFTQDLETGIWLRARFDWITPAGAIVDLKSCRDGEPFTFERTGRGFGYDVQQGHYSHVYELATGDKPTGYYFVTVEVTAPHLVDVHAPADWPDVGESKRKRATALYAECVATNTWPGRPAVIHDTPTPIWALEEDQELELILT